MIECPKCFSKGKIRVELGLEIDSDLYMQLSKTNIRKKGVKLIYANWPGARFYCDKCGFKWKGL